MLIFITRHAWAGERGDPRWPDDSLRELTPEGIERYTKVVKALADRGFEPERIATSPYTRCRQTAEIIAQLVAGKPKIDELEASSPAPRWSHSSIGRQPRRSRCVLGRPQPRR